MQGRSHSQEAVLQLLQPGSCLTMDVIHEALDLNRRQISDAASKLISRGYLERVETGCYQLTPEGQEARKNGVKITSGPNKPHTGLKKTRNTLRRKVWRALPTLGAFTSYDLEGLFAEGTEKNAKNNIQAYLRILAKAGFIFELPRREGDGKLTSNGLKRYRLKQERYTGHLPPIAKGSRQVLDPNTRELHSW